MASATIIKFDTEPRAVVALPQLSQEAADKSSEVLQENHDVYNIFFNDSGFHNHIVHHICTTFALGATPSSLQSHFDDNKSYQRPLPPGNGKVVEGLHDPEVFLEKMGDRSLYSSFLKHFQEEITKKGWKEVMTEYIFKGDKRANTVFHRLFAGILHPIIHLGFGLEFEQPALIAEGLAETCAHGGWSDSFFEETEAYVKEHKPSRKSLKQMLDDIRADKKVSMASRWNDENHMRDGTLTRAREEAIAHVAAWQVDPNNLEEAMAEMIDACAYSTGAAQRKDKQIDFDFFFIHSTNASIFYPAFLRQPWISPKNKAKLLEWKGRYDICQYASKRAPELRLDEITGYKPKQPSGDWRSIFERAAKFGDDGHSSKLIRALAAGEIFCKAFEKNDSFQIKGPMWLQLAHMVMDSVEATNAAWIFGAGFDEAWEKVKPRPA